MIRVIRRTGAIITLAILLIACRAGPSSVSPATATPSPLQPFLEPEANQHPVLFALATAKKSIFMEMYLLTDNDVIDWLKQARERGVDVVVDNVGEKTWEKSLRCLRRMGRLVTCGGTTGPMVVTDVRRLFWYQYSILGSTMGNHREYQAIVRLAHQGKLWPVVDTVYPLDQGAKAFARLQAGEQVGKLVIEVAA